MTQEQITRVGIVAKTGLVAAADHLHRLARWLRDRQLQVVFETETASLAGDTGGAPTYSRDALPAEVDLVVVMGGDGTLLSMATRTAQSGRDIPILGVNFGSLGFLTEARIDELYTVLESVLNGTAIFDERAMLTGMVTGIGVLAVIWWTGAVAWTWYALLGATVTAGVAALVYDLGSRFGPKRKLEFP